MEMLLKRTPNLKSLTECEYDDMSVFDVLRWQYLIISSLRRLTLFKLDLSVIVKIIFFMSLNNLKGPSGHQATIENCEFYFSYITSLTSRRESD